MNDLRVSSWTELQDALFADSWQESIGRFRSTFAFRGRGDAGDDLLFPGLDGLSRWLKRCYLPLRVT